MFIIIVSLLLWFVINKTKENFQARPPTGIPQNGYPPYLQPKCARIDKITNGIVNLVTKNANKNPNYNGVQHSFTKVTACPIGYLNINYDKKPNPMKSNDSRYFPQANPK